MAATKKQLAALKKARAARKKNLANRPAVKRKTPTKRKVSRKKNPVSRKTYYGVKIGDMWLSSVTNKGVAFNDSPSKAKKFERAAALAIRDIIKLNYGAKAKSAGVYQISSPKR